MVDFGALSLFAILRLLKDDPSIDGLKAGTLLKVTDWEAASQELYVETRDGQVFIFCGDDPDDAALLEGTDLTDFPPEDEVPPAPPVVEGAAAEAK